MRRSGVLDVGVDIAAANGTVADERAAEIQSSLHTNAARFERLREHLAKENLLGEVLRPDANRCLSPKVGNHDPDRRRDRSHHHRSRQPRATARTSADPGADGAFRECEPGVERQRQHRRWNRAGKDHGGIDHRQSSEDVFPESSGADRRGNRRRAHANHGRDANAGHDRGKRERQLDLTKQLPWRHPERGAGLDERGVHRTDSGNRRTHDGEQRVDDENGDGDAGAETTDERQR